MSRDFLEEVEEHGKAHWEEVGGPGKYRLDQSRYLALRDYNAVELFTARDRGELIGYLVYIVSPHGHTEEIHALQDAFYLHPEHRNKGNATRLLELSEAVLKGLGVQQIDQSVTLKHDFSALLKRNGYELIAYTYAKRI